MATVFLERILKMSVLFMTSERSVDVVNKTMSTIFGGNMVAEPLGVKLTPKPTGVPPSDNKIVPCHASDQHTAKLKS